MTDRSVINSRMRAATQWGWPRPAELEVEGSLRPPKSTPVSARSGSPTEGAAPPTFRRRAFRAVRICVETGRLRRRSKRRRGNACACSPADAAARPREPEADGAVHPSRQGSGRRVDARHRRRPRRDRPLARQGQARARHAAEELSRDGSEPARQLAPGDRLDHAQAILAVVEAGQRGELLAAGGLEIAGVLDADLLQRLQAVGGEAGRERRRGA